MTERKSEMFDGPGPVAMLTTEKEWREMHAGLARFGADLAEARLAKDAAYAERNQCVAFIAKLARAMGWAVWLGRHDPADTNWERDWLNIVFIVLPTGQVSWHIHDSELPSFAWVPRGLTEWDGHDTREKYNRMRAWTP